MENIHESSKMEVAKSTKITYEQYWINRRKASLAGIKVEEIDLKKRK